MISRDIDGYIALMQKLRAFEAEATRHGLEYIPPEVMQHIRALRRMILEGALITVDDTDPNSLPDFIKQLIP